jgi:hypothetical protein
MLCLGVFGNSCKHKDEYYYIPDDVKSMFHQEVGDWWVFQNDSTGVLDTFTVLTKATKMERAIYEQDDFYTYTEHIYYGYSCHYYSTSAEFRLHSNNACPSGSFFPDGIQGETAYKRKDNHNSCIVFTMDYRFTGDMSIAGSDLHNCFLERTFSFIRKGDTASFWYSPEIGLIKWSVEDSDTAWTLVEYHY